jgi:hypothetical protein
MTSLDPYDHCYRKYQFRFVLDFLCTIVLKNNYVVVKIKLVDILN